MAGHWLRRGEYGGLLKAAGLAVAGVACVAAALAWDRTFPMNKNLWTSSFVLMTSFIGTNKAFLGQILSGFPVPERCQNKAKNSRPVFVDQPVKIRHHFG